MASRFLFAILLAQPASAFAEQANPEQFLPKEILQACPPPAKIAPYIRGCSSNFVAVDWAKSCSQALDKLTRHANAQLQKSFAVEAGKAEGGQAGNFGNTSVDLSLSKLSFEQLISAGKTFQANQKVYQSLVAYPGGENKNVIQALGLTKLYSGFKCVKSCVDAVGEEIAATRRKIGELEKGYAAASNLWKKSDSRDKALSGTLNVAGPNSAQRAAAPGAPVPVVRKVSGKPDGNENTVTGIDKALEDKRKAEKILQKQ